MGDTKFLDPNNLSRFLVAAAIVESSREVSRGRHESHTCNEPRDAHGFLTKSGRTNNSESNALKNLSNNQMIEPTILEVNYLINKN